MESTALQLRYGGKTLRDIVPDSVAQTLTGGSPSLDLDVDSIEGHLLPGHSGAPIFDGHQKVVAIADGGLENGAVAISWGIPVNNLNQLAASKEPTSVAGGGPAHAAVSHALFASEGNVKSRGEFTCSGLSLTQLGSVSYPQASKSVDDPVGLAQLVQFFRVDPSSFTFDIYQHLKSGATFVIPAGSHLGHDGNGNCIASLPSGSVQLRLQVAALNSTAAAQAESQSFEQMVVNGNTLGWVVDPQWTTMMPFTRFDGMVVRRRAYMHVQPVPVMYQDKYLFETMAERNQVFIGSAAMYSVSPAVAQRLLPCRLTGYAGNCGDVRQVVFEWIQAVLAIQLTTFPVG
jgi:hypothetical protein